MLSSGRWKGFNPLSTVHRIRVLGRELQVRSTTTLESVLEAESYVNERVAEVAASVTGGDSQVVAILALMTLAEEQLSSVRKLDADRRIDTERFNRLLAKLEGVV
jgi:cell division protein ZapA